MENKDTEVTDVMFRVYRRVEHQGTVTAIFPYDFQGRSKYDNDRIMGYEHVGQHYEASYYDMIKMTRPATEEEYKDLKRELENEVGYKLNVVERRDRRNVDKHFEKYKEHLEEIAAQHKQQAIKAYDNLIK